MADNKVYVLDDGANQYEAMTKEQVLTAITQAVNDGTISNIDAGFITKIQEMNKKGVLKWWVGTQAEFNAISEKDADTLYLFTDDPLYQDILDNFNSLESKINAGNVVDTDLETRIQLLNKRSKLIATTDRKIITDAILYKKETGSVQCPELTFSLDMTSMEAGQGELLFNLHLDLRLDARKVYTGLMPRKSIDVPFALNWSRMNSVVTTLSFRFFDTTPNSEVDLNFNFESDSIVIVKSTLESDLNWVTGTRIATLKFNLSDVSIKGYRVDLSTGSTGGNINILDFTNNAHQINVIAAYIEQVNGIIEGE